MPPNGCPPVIFLLDLTRFQLPTGTLIGSISFRRNQQNHVVGPSAVCYTTCAVDRNGNGTIDSGAELFGNATAQPDPPSGESKNGFLALAAFDKPENGGNGDGLIDSEDAVYDKLLLWQDLNHDGISQSSELKHLRDFGIAAIELSYHESQKEDQFGNLFRYRSRI